MSHLRTRERRKRRHPSHGSQDRAMTDSMRANHEAAPTPRREADRPASSNVVSLDPLDPLIVRSGRPMNSHADADPRRFPPPSTVAGCLRTAWARAVGADFGPDLARIPVAGPLLLTRTGDVLAPKPTDAVYFGHGPAARCMRAEPRHLEAPCGVDLPDGLIPVQLTEAPAGRVGAGPTWWAWNDLLEFRLGNRVSHRRLSENGWTMPDGDRRTHVSIEPTTRAASGGDLFETEGLDLGATFGRNDDSRGGLRLLAKCGEAMGEALVHLGGKRRLAALKPETQSTWPAPPDTWRASIRAAEGLCMTLLTPGIFASGYRPGWLDSELTGSPPSAPRLKLKLLAAAVHRWEPHSGWDLAKRRPRPTRKLAPAGTTLWLRILDAGAVDVADALWLGSISDGEQDRRDGFGLALPSPWTPPDSR